MRMSDEWRGQSNHPTTSQCPPLRPPTLRILPTDVNYVRFFSTPLTDRLTSAASRSRVISGYSLSSSKIFPALFPTLFSTTSNASRNAVSMNSMNTRASPVLSASKMILRRAFGATGTSRPTGWADVPVFGRAGHPASPYFTIGVRTMLRKSASEWSPCK